jgi:hypothetical protein
MAAVAQRRAVGSFARAKEHGFGFVCYVLNGCKLIVRLMAAIAKGLVFG